MSKSMPLIWPIEPHTKAKHAILKAYLGAWASIVGQKYENLVYVDGFCGPGKYAGGEPGSPIIAIQTVLEAMDRSTNKNFKIEMYFIDNDDKRIALLKQEVAKLSINPRVIITIINGECEEITKKIVHNIRVDKQVKGIVKPSFFFIDPFGVKGYTIALITEIFKLPSSEIFLLFDIDGVHRILRAPGTANDQIMFDVLGIDSAELGSIRNIQNQPQRIKEIGITFRRSLKKNGVMGLMNFSMHGGGDQCIYQLFFLTSNPTGFIKMKEAMWKIDSSGDFKFSDAEEIANQGAQILIQFQPDHVEKLWGALYKEFAGKEVTGAEIESFVNFSTIYLQKHKTATLKKYESSEVASAKRLAISNRKRNIGYPENAKIKFPGAAI